MKATRWMMGALLIVILIGPARQSVKAQTETIPAEVAALFDDIIDIDKLRILNPLKLNPDQMEKLITAIKEAQKEYIKRLAGIAVPPIRQIAQDIKETRRKMLAGALLPKDFDDRVKKMQDDYVAKRTKEDKNTLKTLSDAARGIMTQEQVKTAISLAKTLTMENGKPTLKGEDSQFFNFYVLQTFIIYPRIIPLLEDMKKAGANAKGLVTGSWRYAQR